MTRKRGLLNLSPTLQTPLDQTFYVRFKANGLLQTLLIELTCPSLGIAYKTLKNIKGEKKVKKRWMQKAKKKEKKRSPWNSYVKKGEDLERGTRLPSAEMRSTAFAAALALVKSYTPRLVLTVPGSGSSLLTYLGLLLVLPLGAPFLHLFVSPLFRLFFTLFSPFPRVFDGFQKVKKRWLLRVCTSTYQFPSVRCGP